MSYFLSMRLLPRYRKILKMRDKGLTFEAIGRTLNISRQRAWSLHQRAVKRVKTTTKRRLALSTI